MQETIIHFHVLYRIAISIWRLWEYLLLFLSLWYRKKHIRTRIPLILPTEFAIGIEWENKFLVVENGILYLQIRERSECTCKMVFFHRFVYEDISDIVKTLLHHLGEYCVRQILNWCLSQHREVTNFCQFTFGVIVTFL